MRRQILLAATLSASVFAIATAASAQTAPSGSVAVKSMFDRPVMSSDGTQIGLTKHLAVNLKDGDAPWVAIGGTTDSLAMVPTSKLSGGANGAPFRIDMTAAEFRNAPKWPEARLAEINRPYFTNVLSDHYRHPVQVEPATIAAVGEGTVIRFIGLQPANVAKEDFTGRAKLLGDQVQLSTGRTASVTDLLLDMRAGKVIDAAAQTANRTVSVPFGQMNYSTSQQAFVAPVTENQLSSADDWSAAGNIASAPTVRTAPQTATVPAEPIPSRVFW